MSIELNQARSYIKDLDLGGTPRNILTLDAEGEGNPFDKAKQQAQVVGSGIFSFAIGVDDKVREAISDSALLAQLVANKRVAFEADPKAWFQEYATVLQNVGWVIQDGGFADYTEKGTAGEVHAKIIEVLTTALGPSPAALAVIKSTLDALQAMNPDSPWLTIFNRESKRATIGRFQIGLVEQDEKGQVFVSLLVSIVEAKNTLTQVLFFKFKEQKAKFSAYTNKVSVNRGALTDLSPVIRAKVRAYQVDYVSSIADI